MTAISNARTGYLNGSTDGWAAECLFYYGSAWYLCVLDTSGANKMRMYKSSNGTTWTEMDSAHAITINDSISSYSGGMALSGTRAGKIYIAHRPSSGTINMAEFYTSNDTWNTNQVGGASVTTGSNPAYSCSVQVRSDGDILCMHNTNSQVLRIERWEGSSWTSATLDTPFSNMSAAGGIMTDNSDMAHYFWNDTFANDFTHRSFDGSNTLGTLADIDTAVSSAPRLRAIFPGYINDGGTHRIAAADIDSGGELDFNYSTSSSAPSFTVVNSVSPTSTTDPGAMGSVCVAFNSKWYVLWSGDARGSIHMDVSDDLSSPAFGTDTNVVTGLGNDPIVFARTDGTNGIVCAYTDPTTPSVDTVWAVGSPPATLPTRSQMIMAGL